MEGEDGLSGRVGLEAAEICHGSLHQIYRCLFAFDVTETVGNEVTKHFLSLVCIDDSQLAQDSVEDRYHEGTEEPSSPDASQMLCCRYYRSRCRDI